MAKEAREKMREERSEAFKEIVSKKSEELKTSFRILGKKSNPDIEDHHFIRSQSTV